jgi:hypothetical protein
VNRDVLPTIGRPIIAVFIFSCRAQRTFGLCASFTL